MQVILSISIVFHLRYVGIADQLDDLAIFLYLFSISSNRRIMRTMIELLKQIVADEIIFDTLNLGKGGGRNHYGKNS